MLDFSASTKLQERAGAPTQVALRDVLNGIFFYRRPILLIAGIVVMLGCLAAVLMPPTYRAEARLLPLNAGIYDMQAANGAASPAQALDPIAVVNVEMQLLSSLELHRAVVRRQLGPQATQAQIDAGLKAFEAKLHVTKVTDANVIELTFTARDPGVAADALKLLLSEYFESRANVLTSGRVAFLAGQRDAVKAQLDAANTQIADFQKRNNVVDVAAQIAGAVTQDNALRQQKMATDASLADGKQSIATLKTGARDVPTQVELYSDNTEAARALGEMQTSLLQLQAKRADLASRYMAGAPIIRQIDKQIAGLTGSIAGQKKDLVTTRRTGRNQYYDSARDRLILAEATTAGAAARGSTLDVQIAQSGERLKQLIAVSDTVARMRLERDVLADTYRSLSTQVEQARVQLNQTTSAGSPNVRIIEAPSPPAERSNPPALLIAGSVVAALLIAGTALLLLSSLREVFLTPQEVERALSLPVLCAPLLRGDGRSGPGRREYGRLIAAIDGVPGGTSRSVLLLAPSSRASLQDAALGLGAALDHRAPGRVLLLRFADGEPVPTDAAALPIEPVHGIATAVVGTAACSSRRADARLLAELGTLYDYVIVTAPPTGTSFESIEVAQSVDMVLVVIEAERTRKPVVRDLLVQLDNSGAGILGAILLGRRQHIPQWLYDLVIDRRSSRA